MPLWPVGPTFRSALAAPAFARSLSWSLLVTLVACSSASPKKAATTPTAHSLSAPFDAAKVRRQVHLPFRELGASFAASGTTFDASVMPSGAWTLTPRAGTPLRLGPSRVAVNGVARPLANVSLGRDGQLLRTGAGIGESLRDGEAGVEQSWTFERSPGGAVRVDVPLSGFEFASATDGGLHFKDAATGVGVRYGAATWVDARGRRTRVPARYLDGTIHLEVARELIRGSAYPAVLDPTVGPEIAFDQPIVGPQQFATDPSSIAFDGTNYLVVWGDVREGDTVYGTRVTPSGVVLDPYGIAICDVGSPFGHLSAVAFDGSNYLVVWQDLRSRSTAQIYGARVTPAGTVLDPGGFLIAGGPGNATHPAVSSNGAGFLVAWLGGTPPAILGVRVSSSGTVLDAAPITISSASPLVSWSPAVAFDGTNNLVAWVDGRVAGSDSIYAARVSPSGAVLDPSGLAISTGTYEVSPAIAFDGSEYLVVWKDLRSTATDGPGGIGSIYGVHVSPSGAVLDSADIPISTAIHEQSNPAVTFDGSDFLVAWTDARSDPNGEVYAARVPPAGASLDPNGVLVGQSIPGTFVIRPALASDGSSSMLTWATQLIYSYDPYGNASSYGPGAVYGARVDSAGSVLDATALPLSTSANEQDAPDVAFGGSDYLAVWADWRTSPHPTIYGARVSGAGVSRDPSGVRIASTAGAQLSPAVAFDGTNYLVVWEDAVDGGLALFGARVNPSGAAIDDGGFFISNVAGQPQPFDLAYGGGKYLVAWGQFPNFGLFAVRIEPSGAVLDQPAFTIAPDSGWQLAPSVASDGNNWLVTWSNFTGPPFVSYGVRVTPAGSVLDQPAIQLTSDTVPRVPVPAFDGSRYLVAWSAALDGGTDGLFAEWLDPSGVVASPGPMLLSSGPGSYGEPALVFDGTEDLVVWTEFAADRSTKLLALRVALDGGADPAPFQIGGGVGFTAVQVASDGRGRALVAYSRFDSSPDFNTVRARGVLVTDAAILLGDGGAPDAGQPDAGAPASGQTPAFLPQVSCACSSVDPLDLGAIVIGLAALRRRRRA